LGLKFEAEFFPIARNSGAATIGGGRLISTDFHIDMMPEGPMVLDARVTFGLFSS
jgi:hypothetical protein